MPCHWESSQRPLFVKSVWKNGYRHAILTNEDPAAKISARSPRLSANSLKQERPLSNKNEENLKIPAVQVLLANAKRWKRENNKTAPPIREKLHKSFSFDVIMRDDIKITSKNNMLNNDKSMYATFTCEKANLTVDKLQQSGNSLTERVLLWLDLAGRYNNEKYSYQNNSNIRCFPDKISPSVELNLPEVLSLDESYDVNDKEENLLLANYTSHFDSEYSILSNQPFRSPKSIMELEEDEYRIANVDHQSEKNNGYSNETKIVRTTVKRKVHIFIPNIVNKIPECGSDCGNSNLSILK